nr:Arm DNA-binding domain-containing protein [Luteimonas weifangensis]
MPLTDAAIRKAKPAEKTQRLFDGGGLYLEIGRLVANGGDGNIATRVKKSALTWRLSKYQLGRCARSPR